MNFKFLNRLSDPYTHLNFVLNSRKSFSSSNHLINQFSKYVTIFNLFAAAFYARDGLHDTPRGYPNTDPVLPPANLVTQTVFKTETSNPKITGVNAAKLSTMFMTFGQFLDHDVAFAPHATCRERYLTLQAIDSNLYMFKKNISYRKSYRNSRILAT